MVAGSARRILTALGSISSHHPLPYTSQPALPLAPLPPSLPLSRTSSSSRHVHTSDFRRQRPTVNLKRERTHSGEWNSVRYMSKVNNKEKFNFNTSLSFSADPDTDTSSYHRVTAEELASRRQPPTRVKMLVRDFIDDSLYNPHYGYFSRNVTIFSPPASGYNFNSFRDQAAFQEAVAERYEAEYDNVMMITEGKRENGNNGSDSVTTGNEGLGRQVWHTPTELFKPYYAQTLTLAMLSQYKLNHFPHQDFIIYEIGAGNGSFMIDSLLFLRDHHPEVFARTQYRIIEISETLAKGQRERARKEGLEGKVEVMNVDIFKWTGRETEPCFVVALEVFDNFAHDMIRYDMVTLEPLQAIVAIDETGDFSILYEPLTDPLLRRVLAYRRLLPDSPSTRPPIFRPLLASPILRNLYSALPFAANLSRPDFIPTKAVGFLERLRDKLPAHRLMVADFSELPDAVEGRNGPVVQTRFQGNMVPCETFLVKQGLFDIFFPTDFELLRDTYSLIMNAPSVMRRDFFSSHPTPTLTGASPTLHSSSKKIPNFTKSSFASPSPPLSGDSLGVRGFRRRAINVYTQAAFLNKYGGEEMIGRTRTRDGLSVMTGMYGNARIMF